MLDYSYFAVRSLDDCYSLSFITFGLQLTALQLPTTNRLGARGASLCDHVSGPVLVPFKDSGVRTRRLAPVRFPSQRRSESEPLERSFAANCVVRRGDWYRVTADGSFQFVGRI